jgi:hypothetical protein
MVAWRDRSAETRVVSSTTIEQQLTRILLLAMGFEHLVHPAAGSTCYSAIPPAGACRSNRSRTTGQTDPGHPMHYPFTKPGNDPNTLKRDGAYTVILSPASWCHGRGRAEATKWERMTVPRRRTKDGRRSGRSSPLSTGPSAIRRILCSTAVFELVMIWF